MAVFRPFRSAGCEMCVSRHGFHLHFRVTIEQALHAALVLLGCEGASRIHQSAARPQHGDRAVQNLVLSGCTLYRCIFGPFGHSNLFLAEHALARARCIDHDAVKITRETIGQPLWCLVGHHAITDARTLHTLRQNLGSSGVDLVGDQDTLALHPSSQMRGLTARGCAQVEHALARLGIGQCTDCHRGRLLNVIDTRFIIGMPSRSGLGVIVISLACPRHRVQSKPRGKGRLGLRFFERIDAQTKGARPLHRTDKVRVLFPQKPLHARQKCGWQRHTAPPFSSARHSPRMHFSDLSLL